MLRKVTGKNLFNKENKDITDFRNDIYLLSP